MNHLESLTKKLHALLPELLELTRGCKFTYKDEPMVYIGRSRHGFVQAIHSDGFLWDTAMQKDPEKLIKEFKILGHEIQLHHMLLAMQRSQCDIPLIDYNGNFWDCDDDCVRFWDTEHHYDLALPLHKQSPETILFLDDLLPEPNEE